MNNLFETQGFPVPGPLLPSDLIYLNQQRGEIRTQLTNRRQSLEKATSITPNDPYLSGLLQEVDAALSRLDLGTFGICEACNEAIESERLVADPLIRFCLDHLTPSQQRALVSVGIPLVPIM